jgi:hypothetical protein
MGARLGAGNSGNVAGVAIHCIQNKAMHYFRITGLIHSSSKLTNLIHLVSDFRKIKIPWWKEHASIVSQSMCTVTAISASIKEEEF